MYTLTHTHTRTHTSPLLPLVLLTLTRSKGEALQHFVAVQLVQLLCRTVKLGWFDNESHHTIVDDCKLLLEKNSPAHYIMGLRILNNLVVVRVPVFGGTCTRFWWCVYPFLVVRVPVFGGATILRVGHNNT